MAKAALSFGEGLSSWIVLFYLLIHWMNQMLQSRELCQTEMMNNNSVSYKVKHRQLYYPALLYSENRRIANLEGNLFLFLLVYYSTHFAVFKLFTFCHVVKVHTLKHQSAYASRYKTKLF